MTLEQIKNKWGGIQTCWKDGCYFFSLLTILDEADASYNLFEFTHMCIDAGYMDPDGFVRDPLAILSAGSGKMFTMRIVEKLPSHIDANEFTVEKWYNKTTGYTHFRRRFVDTLLSSQTVAKGQLIGYYIFTLVE